MKTGVTYINKFYDVNSQKSTVTCVLKFTINYRNIPGYVYLNQMPGFLKYVNQLVSNKIIKFNEYGEMIFTSIGKAKLNETDKFDEKFGKKLALTRAQEDAFSQALEFYNTVIHIIMQANEGFYDYSNACFDCVENCHNHSIELVNKKYGE